jgi:hypothetical protein
VGETKNPAFLTEEGRRCHELKCWPEPFRAVRLALKPFEIRIHDRDYQEDDLIYLREYEPGVGLFSGRGVMGTVSCVLEGGQFGLMDGYVAMGLIDIYEFDHMGSLAEVAA